MFNSSISVKAENLLYFLIALSVMTTSGANWTVMFLLGTGIIVLAKYKKFDMNNFKITCGLSILLFLNSYVMGVSSFNRHEFVVYIFRFIGLFLICSYIRFDKFSYWYVKILFFILAMTIPFWIINFLFNRAGLVGVLPPHIFDLFSMDSTASKLRFKSIFWEGGVCAIHANLGLLYCIVNKIKTKRDKIYVMVFLAAIIASISSTGYICLALQLCYVTKRAYSNGKIKIKMLYFIILAAGAVVAEECIKGVVIGKLIGHGASFSSRYDDTLLAILIAKQYFWTGIGVATNTQEVFLDFVHHNSVYLAMRKYFMDDMASSNGLGNCMYKAGVPFTLMYMWMIWNRLRSMLKLPRTESFIICIMFACFFFGEPIMSTPLFLMVFYSVKVKDTRTVNEVNYGLYSRTNISDCASL